MHQFLGGAFLFALDTSSYTTTQFFSYTMATQQKLATRWIHGYTIRKPTISAPHTMFTKNFSEFLGPAVNPYVTGSSPVITSGYNDSFEYFTGGNCTVVDMSKVVEYKLQNERGRHTR